MWLVCGGSILNRLWKTLPRDLSPSWCKCELGLGSHRQLELKKKKNLIERL